MGVKRRAIDVKDTYLKSFVRVSPCKLLKSSGAGLRDTKRPKAYDDCRTMLPNLRVRERIAVGASVGWGTNNWDGALGVAGATISLGA